MCDKWGQKSNRIESNRIESNRNLVIFNDHRRQLIRETLR